MTSPITLPADLPAPIRQSLIPGMLSVPTPFFIYAIGADKHLMPRNGGTTARFLRPRRLNPPVTPITNGIEPAPQKPQRDILDAEMRLYGTGCILNEQTIIQAQDPILAWVTERLGVAAREAEDIILRDYLVSSASVYNCQFGVNGDSPSEVTIRDLEVVSQQLYSADAQPFVRGKEGSLRFGSSPIQNAFLMLANTAMNRDFKSLADFTNAYNYPDQGNVLPSELGAISNFRVLTSSIASVNPSASAINGADVYRMITFGYEAFGHIQQDQYGMQLIYRPPILNGYLALNATLGTKFMQSQIIKQSTWTKNVQATLAA